MAFAQADLDTIRAAIAGGLMKVKFSDGREIMYQRTAELLEAEKLISGQLASASGSYQRTRTPAYRNGC